MKHEEFKKVFYANALEAIEEIGYYPTDEYTKSEKRIYIFRETKEAYTFEGFEHHNGFPYSLSMKRAKAYDEK